MPRLSESGISLRAYDSNGDPVSGALLKVYLAGTSTPVTVYTDAALTIVHDGIANAAGAFQTAYLAQGNYKVDLQDPDTLASLPGFPNDNIRVGDAEQYASRGAILASTEVSRGQGEIWDAGAYRFEEAASGASDQDETTAGGVKLYETGEKFTTTARFIAALARGDTYATGAVVEAAGTIFVNLADGVNRYPNLTGWLPVGGRSWQAPRHSTAALSRLVLDYITSPGDGGGSVTFADMDILGMGSSVGVGANVTNATTLNAPVVKFASLFTEIFDFLGAANITHDNQSVSGDSVSDGLTDWNTGTITPTANTRMCVHIWGMNDSGAALFNAGQTFPGFIKTLARLCIRQIRDGIIPVLATSPGPHTGRIVYSMATPSQNMVWPRTVTAPVDPDVDLWPTAANSAITVTRNGLSATADVRTLMCNAAMRAVAALIPGVVLIDVEPYWLEAVAIYGEDALYVTDAGGTGEFKHPNLLGHQLSYHRAFRDALLAVRDGLGSEVFQGPQHAQVIAGIDPTRLSQFKRSELQPDAPFSILPTDDFAHVQEIYGKDRTLEAWETPTNGAAVPNATVVRKWWTADHSSGIEHLTTGQVWVNVAASATVTFTVPETEVSGTIKIMAKNFTSDSHVSRLYSFVKNGTTIAIEQKGSGAKTGSATSVVTLSSTGADLVITAEQNGTRILMVIDYAIMTV